MSVRARDRKVLERAAAMCNLCGADRGFIGSVRLTKGVTALSNLIPTLDFDDGEGRFWYKCGFVFDPANVSGPHLGSVGRMRGKLWT